VAFLSEDLSRAGILEALRARRVYATSGPRILLRASFERWPMGAEISVVELRSSGADLRVQVAAPEPVERIDLVRRGAVSESVAGEGRRELAFERHLAEVEPGEYLYLRVVQEDGGLAWSSPFFFVE
jgi:hypothetical protein